ncbi:MAG TPA: hypothetical protein VG651_18995 [Stellaceae bacterium]|nr:hypothetical protein [Stellaceae bacterium]
MKHVLAGTIAAAVVAVGVSAQAAEKVCSWTGLDWACGDGNVYTTHYAPPSGPNIAITSSATIDQARDARLADPSRPRR